MSEYTRDRNCPVFQRSDARYERVAQAITDEWQSANQIAETTKDVPLDVSYQLRRLLSDGLAERKDEKNQFGRHRVVYRAVR